MTMNDTPILKQPIDDLIAEYKRESLRCNGYTPEISVKGAWMYITGKCGTQYTYKRNELPQFIRRLKARPTFTNE